MRKNGKYFYVGASVMTALGLRVAIQQRTWPLRRGVEFKQNQKASLLQMSCQKHLAGHLNIVQKTIHFHNKV